MAQVDIAVNGRTYRVACEAGQESRLTQLGAHFDRQVMNLAADLGQIGGERLMLLAALQLCDDLFETRRRLVELERSAAPLNEDSAGGAARRVSEAAERVASLTKRAAQA